MSRVSRAGIQETRTQIFTKGARLSTDRDHPLAEKLRHISFNASFPDREAFLFCCTKCEKYENTKYTMTTEHTPVIRKSGLSLPAGRQALSVSPI